MTCYTLGISEQNTPEDILNHVVNADPTYTLNEKHAFWAGYYNSLHGRLYTYDGAMPKQRRSDTCLSCRRWLDLNNRFELTELCVDCHPTTATELPKGMTTGDWYVVKTWRDFNGFACEGDPKTFMTLEEATNYAETDLEQLRKRYWRDYVGYSIHHNQREVARKVV